MEMMKLAIKICGMRDPDNIRSVAELGPDYIGFIFYPESPRYSGVLLPPELMGELRSDIIKTGVFVNSGMKEIAGIARKYRLDAVQLHGAESPDLCSSLKASGLSVIKAFSITNDTRLSDFEEFINCTDYFLFDTNTPVFGGSGEKFDWGLLEDYDSGHPFFLSGGIGPDDAGRVMTITNSSFYGIDLNSRFEIKPGLKEVEKLKKFIDELKLI